MSKSDRPQPKFLAGMEIKGASDSGRCPFVDWLADDAQCVLARGHDGPHDCSETDDGGQQ